MAKFCQNCGSPLEGAGKFCPSCGAQIMDAAAPQEQDAPSSPEPLKEMQGSAIQEPQPSYGRGAGTDESNIYARKDVPQQEYGAAAGAAMFGGASYVPDEGISQMFFRYDNRLNRKRYIMRALALVVAVTLAAAVLGIVFAVAGMSESTIGTMGTLIGIAGAIPGLMLAVRRLHDLDRPTWWIVGNFVPIVNVLFSLYLLLAKGTAGPNQYGPDPLERQS